MFGAAAILLRTNERWKSSLFSRCQPPLALSRFAEENRGEGRFPLLRRLATLKDLFEQLLDPPQPWMVPWDQRRLAIGGPTAVPLR